MRNEDKKSTIQKVIEVTGKLPYFKIENLKLLQVKSYYLKIILSRLENKGEIVRLKKGIYTSRNFLNKVKQEGNFTSLLEFLAAKIYFPSYLSLEYVLYENNLLTEMPKNFTLITKNKTATFKNKLGIFIYHKIKENLFLGFKTEIKNDFIIQKATKAKALFDFLYLRKGELINKKTVEELRLNLCELNLKDKKELKMYIDLEGSKKMRKLYFYLYA